MAKFTNLTQNFTIIPNWLINNQDISLKAKGLFIFLASKPNDFDFSAERISKLNKEGITSIKNCLKELEDNGFLIRKKIKNADNSRFIGIEYTLTDKPSDGKTVDGKPNDGKSNSGKPSDINNKDLYKKEINKKDNIIKEDFLLEKETKSNICEIYDFEVLEYEEIKTEKSSLKKEKRFNFKKALIDYGFEENLVEEWLQVRKAKKAVNTETAFNSFIREIESRTCDINSMLRIAVERSWAGFKYQWVDNLNNNNNGNGKQKPKQPVIGRMDEETVKRNLQGW